MQSKKQVNYRNGDDKGNCAACSFFQSPDKCSQVEGIIAADGLCDLFTPKQEQAAPDEAAIAEMLFGGGL